jgi:hypothetical protein
VFRSDAQLARVCGALCARVGMGELWTPDGPSDRATALLETGGGPLSSGERVMLLVAWAVWNGDEGARFGDVIHRLDGRCLVALGTLLIAVAGGGAAVDEWLAKMERERRC